VGDSAGNPPSIPIPNVLIQVAGWPPIALSSPPSRRTPEIPGAQSPASAEKIRYRRPTSNLELGTFRDRDRWWIAGGVPHSQSSADQRIRARQSLRPRLRSSGQPPIDGLSYAFADVYPMDRRCFPSGDQIGLPSSGEIRSYIRCGWPPAAGTTQTAPLPGTAAAYAFATKPNTPLASRPANIWDSIRPAPRIEPLRRTPVSRRCRRRPGLTGRRSCCRPASENPASC